MLNIYTFNHGDKTEITVVFWDEDHPNFFIDFIYDVFRFIKWGRMYDIETFFITDNTVIFEDDFSESESYFQTENLHNYKEIPFKDFEKDGENVVIYVSTWNHMFSNKPLQGVDYVIYYSSNLEGTRNYVESIYSWKENKKLKFTFYFSLLVIALGISTICLKVRGKNVVLLKALTTIFCLIIAFLNASGVEFFIVLGLFFGLLGDVFLEFENKFIYGMISFLIGHIFYSLGFALKFGVPNLLVFIVMYSIVLSLYFGVLFKRIKKLRIPIFSYILAIETMFAFSFSPVFKDIYYLRFFLPLAGGLFVFSDLLISIKEFVSDFKYSEIFRAYFAAQLVIALSNIFKKTN